MLIWGASLALSKQVFGNFEKVEIHLYFQSYRKPSIKIKNEKNHNLSDGKKSTKKKSKETVQADKKEGAPGYSGQAVSRGSKRGGSFKWV
jgi:hypothetical protein